MFYYHQEKSTKSDLYNIYFNALLAP